MRVSSYRIIYCISKQLLLQLNPAEATPRQKVKHGKERYGGTYRCCTMCGRSNSGSPGTSREIPVKIHCQLRFKS